MKIDSNELAKRSLKYGCGTSCLIALLLLLLGHYFTAMLALMMSIPLSLLIGLVIGNYVYYTGGTVEETKEQLLLGEDELERSPNIIGFFKDEPIHEWIKIKNPVDGSEITLYWSHTVDLVRGTFTPPLDRWYAVLPPGLVYFAEPETKTP